MTNGDAHIIEQDGFGVAFRKNEMRLVVFPMGKQQVSKGFWDEMGSQHHETLEQFLRGQLSDAKFPRKGKLKQSHDDFPTNQRPALDRLTLTVANACNLKCSYCYAAGGAYYNADQLVMTQDTALNALNWAARAYSRVEHISFFGGEPTLNPDIIELVCDYARYLHRRRVLSHLPSFGITTNGYALAERMIEILIRNQFTVTLSLDGPKEIQDLKRPTRGGGPSYDRVVRNARFLLSQGLDVEFECTFTADHLRIGLELTSLMDYFHGEFGSRTLHCPIVSAPAESPEFIPLDQCLRLQGDGIAYSISNLAQGVPNALSLAVRLLRSLINETPIRNYCPAGRTEITVNADGNVYACFMLMQRETFSFGNVSGKQIMPKEKPSLRIVGQSQIGSKKEVIERFIADADKYSSGTCQQCWAQPLCYGCLGEDLARHGGRVFRSEVPGVSKFCDYRRGVVERFLRAIALAYSISRHQSADRSVSLIEALAP